MVLISSIIKKKKKISNSVKCFQRIKFFNKAETWILHTYYIIDTHYKD